MAEEENTNSNKLTNYTNDSEGPSIFNAKKVSPNISTSNIYKAKSDIIDAANIEIAAQEVAAKNKNRILPGLSVVSIAVTHVPNKVAYFEGENFVVDGMVVTATLEDDSTVAITDYTIINGNNLVAGTTSLVIRYSNLITTNVSITVEEIVPVSIAITTPPTDVSYIAGQDFDPTGMVVTITNNDGSTEVTTDYTINGGEDLEIADTSVEIELDSDNTITTEQAITVIAVAPVSIAVTTPPTDVTYVTGDAFDPTGMVVTITNNDGSTEEATLTTDYEITNGSSLTLAQPTVTIRLVAPNTAITTTQAITVTAE